MVEGSGFGFEDLGYGFQGSGVLRLFARKQIVAGLGFVDQGVGRWLMVVGVGLQVQGLEFSAEGVVFRGEGVRRWFQVRI